MIQTRFEPCLSSLSLPAGTGYTTRFAQYSQGKVLATDSSRWPKS